MGSRKNRQSERADTKRLTFNKGRIKDLLTPEKGRVYYHDTKAPGLCVCVTSAGSKTFYVYRWVDGKPVRIRVGKFPAVTIDQARGQAKLLVAEITKGENPQAERLASRQVPTLVAVFTAWLDHAKLHKRTWAGDERQYNAFLKPWASHKVTDITKADVTALHAKVGTENGIYAANRMLALLRSMLNRAIEDDGTVWAGPNPTIGVKRFRERSRDRFLTPEELPRFFDALAEEPDGTVRDFFWLALLTGARKSNILAMRWDQLTLEGLWRIPRTKNDDPQLIPLVPTARKILEVRRELYGAGPWVFPGPGKTGHLIEVRKAWVRVCKRAELEDLRIHDLRRTLGSWQAMAGTSLPIIGASLGHRDPKATAVYARLGVDPVRESMNQATDAMLQAANGKGNDDE